MVKKISLSLGALVIAFLILISFTALSELILKSKVPVIMGGNSVYTFGWEWGDVSAFGTWVNADGSLGKLVGFDNIALQKSEIMCNRDARLCFQATTFVSGESLMSNSHQYDIERWDDKFIIFGNRNNCTSTNFTISRDTKEVSSITNLIEGAKTNPLCKDAENDAKFRLVDGFKIAWKLREDARPLWLVYIGLVLSLGFLGFSLRKIWWKLEKT